MWGILEGIISEDLKYLRNLFTCIEFFWELLYYIYSILLDELFFIVRNKSLEYI